MKSTLFLSLITELRSTMRYLTIRTKFSNARNETPYFGYIIFFELHPRKN